MSETEGFCTPQMNQAIIVLAGEGVTYKVPELTISMHLIKNAEHDKDDSAFSPK